MKTKALCLLLLLCACFNALAQNPELNTKLVLAQDDMRLKNYRQATHSLYWLMTQAPEHSQAIYIMAYKAYERAAGEVNDKAEKALLLDSMLIAYQLKEQFYGLSDLEKNNLAFRYYKYFRNNTERYEAAMDRYKAVYDSPETVVNNNLASYISMVRLYDSKISKLPVEDITEVHDQILNVISLKLQKGADPAKMERNSALVDQLFYQLIDGRLTCSYLSDMSGKLTETDIDLAKKIMAWSLETGCTQETFFTEVVEVVVTAEPNAGMIKILAQKAAGLEQYDKALTWYEKAIPLEDNDSKRADTYMNMAKLHLLKGDKASARGTAMEAVKLSVDHAATAYSFIGNLYMGSFDDCAEGYDIVRDRAVYMAAYDMFQRANDQTGMQNAQAQMPTSSQAFEKNLYEGDVLDIGCWINVKTTLKVRPNN